MWRPERQMRALAAILWIVALPGIGAWAADASAGKTVDRPQEKLQSTLQSLQSSKADAVAIQEKLEATRSEAADLQERAIRLAASLRASEEKASKEETRYARVSASLEAKQKEFDARAQDYTETVRSLLHLKQLPATALIANPDQVEQVLQATRVLRAVNASLKERALQLKTETAALAAIQAEAAASKSTLDEALGTLQSQQKSLNSSIAERQKLQQSLAKDHAAALAKVEALSKQSQSLQELIGKLEQNQNRIAIAGSAATQRLPAATARGSWRLPVTGSIIHRFGDRKNANETWRGLVLRARSGGSVVAPSAGVVVFTGPFRDYGRMVLLKHKDKHISLVAGLGAISVTLNQQVARGEPIGSMENTAAPELYVELREDSKPVDPAAWYANVAASE